MNGKKTTRLLAAILTLAMLLSLLSASAFAVQSSKKHLDGTKYTVEKVSNPDRGPGEVDGLEAGGDRWNSYAWSMAELNDENGDYIYIGSNRNIIYSIMASMGAAMPFGMDFVNSMVDMVTNGELDTSSGNLDNYNAAIMRYNTATQEMETYFDSIDYITKPGSDYYLVSGFRGAITYKNSVFFNGSTALGKSLIYKIGSNEQAVPETVLSIVGGTMRAMCVTDDGERMYVGGTAALTDEQVSAGIEANCIIYENKGDDEFGLVADYNDFGRYTTSDISVWEVMEYQEELYVYLTSTLGTIIFRGHEAGEDELANANKYGWVWDEFMGESEDAEFVSGLGNPVNAAFTPAVFNGDMYLISFSDAMTSIIYGVIGVFGAIGAVDINVFFDNLALMEKVMDNETYVYRYTSDGRMQMVVGDKDKCIDGVEYVAVKKAGFTNDDFGCTLYNWRTAIYNGRMYLGTFDAYTLYNYVTKLTNGSLLGMSINEMSSQLRYVKNFLALVGGDEVKENKSGPLSCIGNIKPFDLKLPDLSAMHDLLLEKLGETKLNRFAEDLIALESMLDEQATATSAALAVSMINFMSPIVDLIKCELSEMMKLTGDDTSALTSLYNALDYFSTMFANVNRDGIARYIRISNALLKNNNPGFELYSTEDGIHYEAVTLDGFGDKYNYGCRTLLVASDSLYVGTANPFYGAQLWKLTDGLCSDQPQDDHSFSLISCFDHFLSGGFIRTIMRFIRDNLFL